MPKTFRSIFGWPSAWPVFSCESEKPEKALKKREVGGGAWKHPRDRAWEAGSWQAEGSGLSSAGTQPALLS